ncbi:MAG: hypothetical protein CL868_14610 [Cytophagaceae bacterium]|nr:hypothetical protein [Cytophagaceae bacterium]|tara:strand:+ start:1660 stop:2061 length:402 start_codon:yes stop_codon:yes gene_type:complete
MPKRNKGLYYFLGFLAVLIIEICIAVFVQGGFIRSYLGDFLVAIMLYCGLMSFTKLPVIESLIAVLGFSILVEIIQGLGILEMLPLPQGKLIKTITGERFDILDILMYFLGIVLCGFIEYKRVQSYFKPSMKS